MRRVAMTCVAIAVLTGGGTLFHWVSGSTASAQGQAQGAAPVQIVGPLPVPITGSVAIAGTPSINLTNTAATALFVRDVNSGSQQPYQEYKPYSFSNSCGPTVCFVDFSQVPAGKRLIVTNVSGRFSLPPGVVVTEIFLGDNAGGSTMRQFIPVRFQGSAGGRDIYAFSESVSMFSEAGHTPTLSVIVSANAGATVQYASVSGYFVDVL
jgi:hypothetical protein